MLHRPAHPAEGIADEAVFGLDNVRLDLPLAGVGSRALAGFIDYSILGLLMVAWFVAFIAAATWLGLRSGWAIALLLLGLFALNWGYFAAFEIALGGRTPGKAAVGLRVVSSGGGKPSATALLIRNLIRAVDLLVGVPMMAVDARARRLGDRLAGTLVVHHRRDESELIVHRIPSGWGAREGALLEAFLARVDELEPERAQHLARRLLAWIERDDPHLLPGRVPGSDSIATVKQALLGKA